MSGIVYLFKRKYWYYRRRIQELSLCAKEFYAGRKLDSKAQEASFKNGMLLQVHRLEKGLGLDTCEPGHSADVAKDIIIRLEKYIAFGYNISDYAFFETFSVLHAYLAYQQNNGNPDWKPLLELENGYSKIVNLIGENTADNILKTTHAGAYSVNLEELQSGISVDLDKLFSSRHSIRMFSKKEISDVTIKRVIELANKAPSACNRQPARVYFVKSTEKVKTVDTLITGNHGFEGKTPFYAIITEDRAQFSGEEQFQWYINGGIYLSYLTLAMHNLGIGSCIMQWKAFYKNEKKLKRALSISDREAIIAIVGCGYYKEDTKVICAERKPLSETLYLL